MNSFYIIKFNNDETLMISTKDCNKIPYISGTEELLQIKNIVIENMKIEYAIFSLPFQKKDFEIFLELLDGSPGSHMITLNIFMLMEYLNIDETKIKNILKENILSKELQEYFYQEIPFENKINYYEFFREGNKKNYLISVANMLCGRKLKNYVYLPKKNNKYDIEVDNEDDNEDDKKEEFTEIKNEDIISNSCIEINGMEYKNMLLKSELLLDNKKMSVHLHSNFLILNNNGFLQASLLNEDEIRNLKKNFDKPIELIESYAISSGKCLRINLNCNFFKLQVDNNLIQNTSGDHCGISKDTLLYTF